jgi:hypothetical protein
VTNIKDRQVRCKCTLAFKMEAGQTGQRRAVATVTAKILGLSKQTLENWFRLHGKGHSKALATSR